jgi:outer membrane protein OmpA-like peptidoglycan-associated protein
VPAQYFSVRWTGWLLPPASGRYVLHVTVDDGVRIWLNDKIIMDEWRPQPVRTFNTSVELKAGEPYKLRVDYYQEILDTSMRITWERPDIPLKPPASSWRNLWGMTADTPKPEPIPTGLLYSRNPRPTTPPSAAKPTPKAQPPKPAPTPTRAAAVAAAVVPSRRAVALAPKPVRRPAEAPKLVTAPAYTPAVAAPVSAVRLADSSSTASLAGLAVGGTITLPDLYFDQGKAVLLPRVRTALDALATTLRTRPELRFEVQGHTDNVGNAELNRQLSQQRAEAVCLYLTAHGVATAQLQPKGYGGTQPVADNADPAQRPRNRRVVLRRL